MILVTASDIHIRHTKPRARRDAFFLTQFKKVDYILQYCSEHGAAALLVAGDVFDTPFVPFFVVGQYTGLFRRKLRSTKLIAVFGQHDLRYHSLEQVENTPLHLLLLATDGVRAQPDSPVVLGDSVKVYGVSWGEKIHPPDDNCFSVLLIHRMVTKSGALFPGQTDYIEAKKLLSKTGYDLIVTGDNHEPFYEELNGRLLINNGSLVRLRIDQKDVKPRFSSVEIENGTIKDFKWVYPPHLPGDEVFREDIRAESKEDDVLMFLDQLKEDIASKPFDFSLALRQALDMVDESTKKWVEILLQEVDE